VETPQPLAHVLAAGYQVGPVKGKAGPVFEHPQALSGAVEIGIEEPFDRGTARGRWHGF
jgi:hypothetical protein